MYQRSRGCSQALMNRTRAMFSDSIALKVRKNNLQLHVLLFLNHSKVVITRGRSKTTLDSVLVKGMGYCELVYGHLSLPCHCNPKFLCYFFLVSSLNKLHLILISVMWIVYHVRRCLYNFFKSLNASCTWESF